MRFAGSILIVICLLAGGCERDPEEAKCPAIGEGELIITEIRGPQSPEDQNGPWIELFNASGNAIDLEGTKIRFRNKTGSTEIPVLVRRSVSVAAGAYVVLGVFEDIKVLEGTPAFADYGFADDFRVTWLGAAAVDVESCGELVDRLIYDALPRTGTFSFGPAPDATMNDDLAKWCTDAASAGTPQAANITCP